MSKFAVLDTQLTDEVHIISALKQMGYAVEQHEIAARLNGYSRDDHKLANVIVRQHQADPLRVLTFGDVGFLRESSGNYKVIIDDYHPENVSRFVGQVKQGYAEFRTLAVAKVKGYLLAGREVVDGKVKLRFSVR
jgi:hypothetical protein